MFEGGQGFLNRSFGLPRWSRILMFGDNLPLDLSLASGIEIKRANAEGHSDDDEPFLCGQGARSQYHCCVFVCLFVCVCVSVCLRVGFAWAPESI